MENSENISDEELSKISEDLIIRGDKKFRSEDFQGAIIDYYDAVLIDDLALYIIDFKSLVSLIDDPKYIDAKKILFKEDKLIKEILSELFTISAESKKIIGNFKGYLKDYRYARKINSGIFPMWGENFHFTFSQPSKSINKFSKAIKLDPQDKELLIKRGMAKGQKGDYEGAVNDFIKASKLGPEDKILLGMIGDGYNDLENYKEAINYYSKAIKLDINPENGRFFALRSIAKMLNRNYESALDDYYESLKLSPNIQLSFEFASDFFDKLIKNNVDKKKIESIFFNLGLIKFKIGEFEPAIDFFSKAISLNSLNSNSFLNRGLANEELGLFESAYKDFLEANKINSNNQIVLKKLSRLKGTTNKPKYLTSQLDQNIKKLKSSNKNTLGSRNFKPLNDFEYQKLKEKYEPLVRKGKNFSFSAKKLSYSSLFTTILVSTFFVVLIIKSGSFVLNSLIIWSSVLLISLLLSLFFKEDDL